jgi:hypothetical protein
MRFRDYIYNLSYKAMVLVGSDWVEDEDVF